VVGLSAAGDGGDDAHGLAVGDLGVEAVEIADVVVVDEDVDEAAQRTVVEQPLGEPGVTLLELGEDVAERARGDVDRRRPARERAHGGRDSHGDGHARNPTGTVRNHPPGMENVADASDEAPAEERPEPACVAGERNERTVAGMRVLAALDKFRGTLTAAGATAAVAAACWELDHDCDEAPMSDGGEGLLDVFGGGNRTSVVAGPLGEPVEAAWRLDVRTLGSGRCPGLAVIEMATASGLELVGGAESNDPLTATTRGTGELIAKAIEQGARTVLVGLGGSATTDGGLGAIEALGSAARLQPIDLQVACDVRTRFVDAAAVFGPQKGATGAQVKLLRARLERLAEHYVTDYGVNVREIDGTGAAGGLAGGLLAVGARLLPGFELVAEHVGLDERLAAADVVVTGEGHLDAQSLDGKVVGGVRDLAADAKVPVVVIVGDADPEVRDALERDAVVVSLVERFGEGRAFGEPQWCIEHATCEALEAMR
jgi:glycerate kinase